MKVWGDLVEQWRERRTLRLGIYAVGAILWLQGLLVWHDWLTASARETLQIAQRIARLKAEAAESQWPQRATDARSRLAVIDRQVTQTETLGLAQADLQDWLGAQAARAGLTNPTVTVAGAAQGAPVSTGGERQGPDRVLGLGFQVQAQLRADFKPLPVYDFLAALEKGERRVWVESMSIRPGAGGRFELSVVAAYRRAPKASQ